MRSEANRNSLEPLSFIEANEEFNALILKVYRSISQKVQGTNFHIYRQLAAGINASYQFALIHGLKIIHYIKV